ncbi:FAD:protein FMN transferase [bacterium]|nr:FAD:protein FMN transferase [bacterium]
MGSRWTARLDCEADLAAELTEACAAAVERVESQCSNWRTDSDLSRVNAAPVGDWVPVPAHLMRVLTKALDIGRASDGLFDIAVGALVGAWGFGPAEGRADPAAIAAHLGKPLRSFDTLDLDHSRQLARKRVPMTLDLSGIAKGYGVDVLMQTLRDRGVTDSLCGLDGELSAQGQRPDGRPWAVALEEPDSTRRSGRSLFELSDRAIATSGSYRHFVTLGHLRVSHTMNPRTGGPAVNALVSVSVLHDTCMEADAWATVLMVLGEAAGPDFARAHGLQAIFLSEAQGEIRETLTGFVPA